MSLTDALLLDPQKLDIWIALRTDGAKGSGTESDPYDGSTRDTPIISVSNISGSSMTATATASNHGFKNGDRVLIAGATGGDSRYYNGTFSISNVAANTFQYTMRGTPQNSPATGTITCRLDPYQLDAVMSSLPASPPATVHIGPGLFETKGFSPYVTGGWQPKSGQKIIGSGIGVTVLKLVGAPVPNVTYWAIGTAGYLDSFEASDFTVDCNLGDQSLSGFTFPPITCGALSVPVSHIRFRRIRAINFGTLDSGLECFVMVPTIASVGTPEALDCVIEDCIMEQPAINNNGIITVVLMAAGERSTDGYPAFHRACVVRNCVIDCEYRENPVPISGITINVMSGVATVTTTLPHGRANGNWVRISGAILNGTTNNSFNGSYTISNVTTYGFTYTPNPTQTTNPTGDMWVGRFSSHLVPISSISWSAGKVSLSTATPHFRVEGNNVVVNEVYVGSYPMYQYSAYNGSFEVTRVLNPFQLEYQLGSDPGIATLSGFIGVNFQAVSNDGGTAAVVEGNRIWNTRIGGPYHDTWNTKDMIVRNNHYRAVVTGPYQLLGGPSSISGAGLAIPLFSLDHIGATALAVTNTPHGLNSNELVTISGVTGPLSDDPSDYNGQFPITVTGSTTFQYTMTMGIPSGKATGTPGYFVFDKFQPETNTYRPLNTLVNSFEGGLFVATAESWYQQNGLAVGDAVRISRASRPQYNGNFTVIAVIPAVPGTSNEKFKYVLPADPVGDSTSGYFGRIWQAGRVVIENNVIELVPTPTNWGPPTAILFGYASFVLPPLFRQVVIRGNIIRHVDGLSDPPPPTIQGAGIQVSGCGDLIVEDNLVDLDRATPIEFSLCDKVRFFNDRTSAGTLIQGYDTGLSRKADELTTQIEDAWLVSF